MKFWKTGKEKKEEKRKKTEMRYEHYKRVVQWDRLQRFPYIQTQRDLPKVEKLTRTCPVPPRLPEEIPLAKNGRPVSASQ